MKPWRILTLLLLLDPLRLWAHIGSPDVFFEGKAGPHNVRVVVRPPRTLPGGAEVSVRVESAASATVSLRAEFGDASASWVVATVSPAEPHLHMAELWLLRRGVYRLEVAVMADETPGNVVVPLNIAPTKLPQMPPMLGTILVALGLLLVASAVWLAGKIARESALPPGRLPGPSERAGGRRAAMATAAIVVVSLGAGGWRWRSMDRLFRDSIVDQPVPVNVEITTAGDFHLLRMMAAPEATNPGWDTLVTDHGKLVHLFLVREPAGDVFAHLHPVRRTPRSFETLLPPLPAGQYAVYGEVTHVTGASQTLVARTTLPEPGGLPSQAAPTALDEILCQTTSMPPGNSPPPVLLDADAAWTIGAVPLRNTNQAQIFRLAGGETIVFENAGDLIENRDTTLRFSVFGPAGERLPLRPYMGMAGHAVLRHNDGGVFAHLHPLGTISMAAQQLFTPPEPNAPIDPSPPPTTAPVAFPYAFPRTGEYLVWVQVHTAAGIVTGCFRVLVRANSIPQRARPSLSAK